MNSSKAKITILNEIFASLDGVPPSMHGTLSKLYAEYTDNYRYDPRFKLKRWDGKLRFYTDSGKMYNAMIPEIYKYLKTLGYSVNIVDKRENKKVPETMIDNTYLQKWGITLADHQVGAINALLANVNGIIEAGTGAGKTYITAALVKYYEEFLSEKVLVVVPNNDLVEQTAKDFDKTEVDYGIYSGSKKDLTKQHCIATWQALQNNTQVVNQFTAIIVDECHQSTAESVMVSKIIKQHCKGMAIRVGLTGSMPKSKVNLKTNLYLFGQVVYSIKSSELIDMGWSAEMKLNVIVTESDLTELYSKFKEQFPDSPLSASYKLFSQSYFVDYASEAHFLSTDKDRLQYVADIIDNARHKNGNTLCLVPNLTIAKRLSKLVSSSSVISGQTKNRDEYYDSFKEEDSVVLFATYNLASTGLNIPRIFNLFLIDAGKSYTRVVQSIGRGLRKAKDKKRLFAFDVSSSFKYSTRHRGKRLKYYREQNYKYKTVRIKI